MLHEKLCVSYCPKQQLANWPVDLIVQKNLRLRVDDTVVLNCEYVYSPGASEWVLHASAAARIGSMSAPHIVWLVLAGLSTCSFLSDIYVIKSQYLRKKTNRLLIERKLI